MSPEKTQQIGTVTWRDLTVENAEAVRDFYAGVVGWEHIAQDMGGYSDFSMLVPGTKECVAGICHARGTNADLPPQWLPYFTVEDVDASAARCREQGGEVMVGPKGVGGGRYCVIRDPAGAVCALYSPPSE